MAKKPKDSPEAPQWEACAPDLTPYGTRVQILGREWEPGVWSPVTEAEKRTLDVNWNVLLIRERADA